MPSCSIHDTVEGSLHYIKKRKLVKMLFIELNYFCLYIKFCQHMKGWERHILVCCIKIVDAFVVFFLLVYILILHLLHLLLF